MKLLRQRLAANVTVAGANGGPPKRATNEDDRRKQAAPKKHGSRKAEEELASLSKQDLMKRARSLGIAGRSTMAKNELIKAIRQAA